MATLTLNDGHTIPIVGLGTFNSLKKNEMRDAVLEAIDVGYRHIDTASVYETEIDVGEAVEMKIQDGVVKREDLCIVTKLWNTEHHQDAVEPACRESLKKLRLDYIDLYLIHWPVASELTEEESSCKDYFGNFHKPAYVDLLDTWIAMEELVLKGLVRSIGVSNFNITQIERMLNYPKLRIKPSVNQIEIHPYYSNTELVRYCQSKNIVVTAYTPFGKNLDSGSRKVILDLFDDKTLIQIASKYNKTPAQVALRWGIDRGYTVIPKSSTPSRIKQNFEMFDFSLTKDEMEAINKLNRNRKFVKFEEFKNFPEFPF